MDFQSLYNNWFQSSSSSSSSSSPSSPSEVTGRYPQSNDGPFDMRDLELADEEFGEMVMSDADLVDHAQSAKLLSKISILTNKILHSTKRSDPSGLQVSEEEYFNNEKEKELSETDSSSDSSIEEKEIMTCHQQDEEIVGELYYDDDKEKHIQLFAHDKVWTILGLLSTWLGFMFAYLARASSEFVTLEIPLYIDPAFNSIGAVGMINLKLCYNETFIGKTGCFMDKLESDEVDDNMFQVARSFAFLALLLGAFMSIMLTFAVFWYSINLRPIGLGYLFAYFLQSFSFLFFDTSLCTSHGCTIASGGYNAAAASIFWILSCISASRMDAIKYRKLERKTRRNQKKRRKENKNNNKKKLKQQKSALTTSSSVSSTDSDSHDDKELTFLGATSPFPVLEDLQASFPQTGEAVEVGRKNVVIQVGENSTARRQRQEKKKTKDKHHNNHNNNSQHQQQRQRQPKSLSKATGTAGEGGHIKTKSPQQKTATKTSKRRDHKKSKTTRTSNTRTTKRSSTTKTKSHEEKRRTNKNDSPDASSSSSSSHSRKARTVDRYRVNVNIKTGAIESSAYL